MRKRLLSLAMSLALCLSLVPAVALAAETAEDGSILWPQVGETVVIDDVEYVYGGQFPKDGLSLVFDIEPAVVYTAGEGYAAYWYDEDGTVSMTLKDAAIAVPEATAISVDGYDLVVTGVGSNTITAGECGIMTSGGSLTVYGTVDSITAGDRALISLAAYGFCDDGTVDVTGGDVVILGTLGDLQGENAAIEGQASVTIGEGASVGSLMGGMTAGTGTIKSAITISGTVGDVVSAHDAILANGGVVTITETGVVGNVTADCCGICGESAYDVNGPDPSVIFPGGVVINGTVGHINAFFNEDDGMERYGIHAMDGDVVIGETAQVASVTGGTYGVYVQDGSAVIADGAVAGEIVGGRQAVYVERDGEEVVDPADVPSDWAADYVTRAIEEGIVPEALQGQYRAAATRAEFCALATALYEAQKGEILLEDMGEVEGFTDTEDVNVLKMAALDVVNGMGDGTFAPDQSLTREQAATMLSRLANAMEKPMGLAEPTFADNDTISHWAFGEVGQLQETGIMEGVGENKFDPKGSYTREQSIITMVRMLDYYLSET